MSERLSGTCKWFNEKKGFGYIMPSSGGEDLFVHQSEISARGYRSLGEGEEVEFSVVVDALGKRKAVQVTAPGGGPVTGRGPGEPERGDAPWARESAPGGRFGSSGGGPYGS
ncbi:cold shock domain-containing protein [Streptomyces vinaceus]|uniref:Cold shock domain-containing protein n=1 Tax=Streptomyces vinaceus TaxID=1960 RepID=A0A5J6JM05_STRVI|nr:cold shock domain-containing protein [Streptomyces vinaceus]QEV49534.1 cold shock domain-containing protein [Streptomyces vinaceus]GHE46537.1 hypothetical protein GCM10017778_33080 [Streptomyces vinaceus]